MTEHADHDCRIRFGPNLIEGEFNWAHDPFFRPSVGIFSAGRLALIAPSVRRPGRKSGGWCCQFSATTETNLGGSGKLEITVLETGRILYSASIETLDGRLPVSAILGAGEDSKAANNSFASFLLLPLTDQISILYRDYLGRIPDSYEAQSYRLKITAGEMSILDVRDEIATGEEAQNRFAQISRHDRPGRWCIWGGYDEVLPFLVPLPIHQGITTRPYASSNSPLWHGFAEIQSPSSIAAILAVIAVGRSLDLALHHRWIDEHSRATEMISARITEPLRRDEITEPATQRHYRIGSLLPAMEIGGAGIRTRAGTLRARGKPAYLVYGPYWRLEPGRHSLSYEIAIRGGSGCGPHMAVEVVYGDILLARRDIVAAGDSHESAKLDFSVPGSHGTLLRDPMFEFRVSSSGTADVELRALSLDIGVDPDAPPAPPQVENWLLLLKPGAAGLRSAAGIAGASHPGHVFFGPYVFILPGAYRFAVECEVPSTTDSEPVLLEVLGPDEHVLVQRHFTLSAGRHLLEADFRIETASTVKDLFGPLEFRLGKTANGTFDCVRAELKISG